MSEQGLHGFLTVQSRGTVALPPVLRVRYQLDRPGAQVELTQRADGVLELRPVVPAPATEAWFWDERWQAGERRVDELVAAGEVKVFAGPEEFLGDLDANRTDGPRLSSFPMTMVSVCGGEGSAPTSSTGSPDGVLHRGAADGPQGIHPAGTWIAEPPLET